MSRLSHVVFFCVALTSLSVYADESGSNYQHLKTLDKLVGKWSVNGQSADGRKHVGEEQVEWLFDKNALKGAGWWQQDGDDKKSTYEYFVVWNPLTKQTDMHFVVSDGGSALRSGYIDENKGVWKCWHKGATGDGDSLAVVVEVRFAKDGKSFDWEAIDGSLNGEPWSALTLKFTRIE
jgi:hypothetical protein